MDSNGERLQRAAGVVVLVGAVVGLGWLGWRTVAAPAEQSGATLPAEIVTIPPPEGGRPTEAPSDPPSETTSEVEPAPSESATADATEEPAVTVLFGGGPAVGPWQQLGTVAEITHPDAPQTARYSYTQVWSDPEEENQSDELWDQIVVEVAEQLIELGTPVDRPAFGAAPGSEPFNSSGGMQDVYGEDGRFTAYWSAVFEDSDGVARAYFPYVIDFDAQVVERDAPVIYRDDGTRDFDDNVQAIIDHLRAWADELGYGPCESC